MRTIPHEQVVQRLRVENPWWEDTVGVQDELRSLRVRQYIRPLLPLVRQRDVRRAVLLMGPRRVGKTVLVHHVIAELLAAGIPAANVCYVSVEHPIYNGCGLHTLLAAYIEATSVDVGQEDVFLFFDEIQYLKDWEIHLKALVDDYPRVKFVASGSAAAALRLKSAESGAGRFTEFLLPPVTFAEYLHLLDREHLVEEDDELPFRATDIAALNESFLHYLNFGGYPEVIFSRAIQADPVRFIKSDIIDKVLLRDLPSLYGIQDIQELNSLFTTLAWNTAGEVSLDQLSKHSGVAKNTIKRYIEYLEAAFLIKVVHRIDRNARRFQRANYFKVYLTNPSIRSALFAPMQGDERDIGSVVETGIFSQWFHSSRELYYARWDHGEVDMVGLSRAHQPQWAVEVKWTDRYAAQPGELTSLLSFCQRTDVRRAVVTTRTAASVQIINGVSVEFMPSSVYCYTIGHRSLQVRPA